ncbi:BamA/TamA family outer membrane protein [Prochlorococcus sp. MIT 1300]|uniref:BamA/TamA family outer membrane protein n=1 Tax=Prochlorococcus sp. MIT 1300 TaxID=3096218 RepID=UPI002A748445|nr:BamA/TamA family outer membrane protein [Prochlorococcus sp. MIT 1300]
MASFFYIRTTKAFRRSAYGLAMAIPLLAVSAQAQPSNKENKFGLGYYYEGDLFAEGTSSQTNNENDAPKIDKPSKKQVKDNSSKEAVDEQRVLVSEVIIQGLEGHPQQEKLELAAYDAMRLRPRSRVTRKELKLALDSIYATGWFSGVRIEPVNGPLGVQLIVRVQPNPVLTKVELEPADLKLSADVIARIFKNDYGRTLNLKNLQVRMKQLRSWYVKNGYSLARITGPNRVTSNGLVQLKVIEGIVSGIEVQFLNKEGDDLDEKGEKIVGKTKEWVISREISIKSGDVFNRKQLEEDIKRIYETSLFSDVKVTIKPVTGEPGKITILLGITEQSTGSLSGGLGYSQSQGVFGQIGLQDTNLLGRSWSSSLNLTYGEYGGLANFTFSDPWIKGDVHRTSYRTSLFLSREIPQVFRSRSSGSIRGVSDYYDGGSLYAYDIKSDAHLQGKFESVIAASGSNPEISWFEYQGDSVALQKKGGSFVFSRPLNGGDPYKKVPWSAFAGVSLQSVKPIDYSGNSRPYGVPTSSIKDGKALDKEIICVAFDCAKENNLFGIRTGATYNNLDNPKNPTSGNFLTIATEQFVSIGDNSPTFNRARASYTHFVPVNWLKLTKGCRPKKGEKYDCAQAIGFQVKAGTTIGQLPPYEAFCLGGSNSVRGWNSCDLAVGRSFGEASVEYRFPIWNIISGELFVDGGSDLGSQASVPGKPGKLLDKPGSGFSLGTGLIVTTPVGPLRLEAASKDLDGDWRFNLGVGWKF